jgi:hypothetical protein
MTSALKYKLLIPRSGHLLLFVLFMLIVACKNKTQHVATAKKQTQVNLVMKKQFDTLINTPCALVIYPTDHQLDSMKKKDGEDFYTIVDDDQFYLADCLQYLDTVKLKTIVKQSKGIIAFKTLDNQLYKFDLDTLSWSVILFNGKTKPTTPDITDFKSGYRSYMK